jgi:hypothetical protein
VTDIVTLLYTRSSLHQQLHNDVKTAFHGVQNCRIAMVISISNVRALLDQLLDSSEISLCSEKQE